MKKLYVICAVLIAASVAAQTNDIKNWQAKFDSEKTDTGKIIALYNLSAAYLTYKPDTALRIAMDALARAKKISYKKGQSWAYFEMASAFYTMGNDTKALEYYIEQLKMEEGNGEPYNLAEINMQIAAVYKHQKEFEKAIAYSNTAEAIIEENLAKDSAFGLLKMYSLLDLGDLYEKDNRLDSALQVTQQGLAFAEKRQDTFMIGASHTNLGNIYAKKDSSALAFKNYFAALPYLRARQQDQWVSEAAIGIAKLYEKKGLRDSAEHFARNSFVISKADGLKEGELDAAIFLTAHFTQLRQPDSSLKYMSAMVALKDTLNNEERIKELQIISTNEQLRQAELLQLKLEESRERSEKLQFFAIVILIPTLFLVTVILSRRKVHARVIKYSGIVSLLFLFEFITLLSHPLIKDKTGGSPLLEILILVAVAAVLIPTHHKIEHWFIKKLEEVNSIIHHQKAASSNIDEQLAAEEAGQ